MWNKWILSVISEIDGPRALELGHGPGHLQQALHDKGIQIYGLDASSQMGRLALRRLRRDSSNARLVNGMAQELPFPTGSFQQVVATFPTEYIYSEQTLKEVHRVLSPGGKLVILPLAWITGKRWVERAAAWLFRVTGQSGEWQDSYLDPLRQTGFRVTTNYRELKSSRLIIIRAVKLA